MYHWEYFHFQLEVWRQIEELESADDIDEPALDDVTGRHHWTKVGQAAAANHDKEVRGRQVWNHTAHCATTLLQAGF